MNLSSITQTLTKSFYKVKFQLIKHAPDILVVGGVGAMVAGTGLAIKSTLDASEVLTAAEDELAVIDDDASLMTSDEDRKEIVKSKSKVYIHYGLELAKIYVPSLVATAGGAVAIFSSHSQMKDRNIALAGSYAALSQAFQAYRKRVADEVGTDVEQKIAYDIRSKKVQDSETGKTKEVKYSGLLDDPNLSMYAVPFKSVTRFVNDATGEAEQWHNDYANNNVDDNYKLAFLKSREAYLNLKYETCGYLFLEDVYKELGLLDHGTEATRAARVVGWIANPHGADPVHKISFFSYIPEGVDPYESPEYILRDADGDMILDFNVDGMIMNLV